MCKGSNSTTTTTQPNGQAQALYGDLLSRAQGVANMPFQSYSGEFVAPVNQQQNTGIANINAAQPVFGQALGMAQQAAQPITAEQIRQYQSPYTQDVVNATQAQFNNQNAQAQNALTGQAAAQNAMGGNRLGVAQGQLANQQQLAQAPVIAGLMNQGYTTGLNTALTEQQALAQGAYGVANMGQGELGAAGAQIGAGSLQQGTQQAQDSALYNQFLQQQAYPFQTTQWLSGIGTGVGSQMGGTSTTTGPKPSVAGQIAGGLTSGVGLLGASGAFGSAGWLAPALMALRRGGGVAGYAEGGGVAGPETLPEGPDTLLAQQDQLLNGNRKAQMFPNGTPELPVPEGIARTQTPNGAFHYNPAQVGADDVHSLSGMNRENDLLDLGPFSKEQIAAHIQRGETPFAIVERTPAGVEVRAAVGTKSTLPLQMPAFEQKKAPGNIVVVEPLAQTLAKRQASNGVANRAVGGPVGGQAASFGGVPYSGVRGYVPTADMARGPGAPRPPGLPGQKSNSIQDQLKNISGLGKSIYDGLHGQGSNGLDTDTPDNSSGIYTGDATVPGFGKSPGFGGSGGFDEAGFEGPWARGGGVANYADGGAPQGEDEFGPTYDGAAPVPEAPAEAKPKGLEEMYGATPDQGWPAGVAPPPALAPPKAPTPQPSVQVASAAPTSDAPAVGVAAPEGTTRGARNNNPGNIEDGPFARSLPGYAGSDGRFAKFDTPQEGQQAAEVLLTNYGQKGVNTLSGIVNRWAPASDGNDTKAYVAKLSQETGIPPDQPINLEDPKVRSAVAKAMFKQESGGGSRATRAGIDPSSAEAATPTKASANGVDWSGNSKLWPSMMAAGLGMLASQSPFPGVALGEGGLQGLATYQGLKGQEQQQALSQSKLDLEAKKLGQQADIAEKNFQIHNKPYSELTMGQRKQLAVDAAKLEEQKRHNDLSLRKPEKYTDEKGREHMLFPTLSPDGKGIEWGEYDPATKQIIPFNKTLPGAPTPSPGVPQSQAKPGFQTAAFDPAKDGIWKVNQQQAEAGPQDYSTGSPYIEKGMEVPEPADTAGRSATSIKTDAEKYLQTGKLPAVRSGRSPVAVSETNYSRAVQNYGNALASSRGMTPEQVADAWRTAPGTLRFILGKDGRDTVSLGTATRHLDTLAEYAKAWNAGDVGTINRLSASISREFGGTAATNLETVAHIVGPEIVKAIGIAGAGTREDRAGMESQFTTARSYPQVMGAIVATQKLMGGQLEGKRRQAANAGVSEERFKSLIGDRPYEILTSIDKGGSPLTKPSLEQFLTAAKKANPDMSDDQLKDIYKKKYGQ